jgi:cyanophycinase
MAIVMDPRTVSHNNHERLETGTLISMTGLTTHFLSNGDIFSITDHTVEVLPIDAAYI